MNLIEQIAIAGISLAIGTGAVVVAVDADKAAANQTEMINQMASPHLQELAIGRAMEIDRIRRENLKAQRAALQTGH